MANLWAAIGVHMEETKCRSQLLSHTTEHLGRSISAHPEESAAGLTMHRK